MRSKGPSVSPSKPPSLVGEKRWLQSQGSCKGSPSLVSEEEAEEATVRSLSSTLCLFPLRRLQSTPWYRGSRQSRFIPASSKAREEPISPDQMASQRSAAQSSGPPSPREEEEEEEEEEEGEEKEEGSEGVAPPSFPGFLPFSFPSFAPAEAPRSTPRASASRARAQDCTCGFALQGPLSPRPL